MPGTQATGSTTVAIVDSKITASLCDGKICVDLTPSVYIGSGKDNVLGANVQITNPFGVIVKPYGSNYEIAPALSGGMDAPICFNIPTQAGNYQYGQYKIDVTLYDDAGNPFTVTKYVKICEPDKDYKTRNYGSLSAQVRGICKDGKVYIIIDGVPNYNGKQVESQENDFTITYPTGSGLSPLTTTIGYLSLQLYEGVYKVTGEICAIYNYGDNVFVEVKYKVKKEKDVKCVVDECCVLAKLAELHQKLKTDCSQEEKDETSSVAVDALRLLKTAQLAAECGEDASDYVSDLEALLGCKCTCNCNEGTPLIPTATSKDYVIQGCNVAKESVGLTDTYTIENYEYNIVVTPNGGVIVVGDPVLSNCTKIQTLTFSISAAYAQIRTLADASNDEADFWASIINKSLRDLNPSCLGLTAEQWNAKTFFQKFKAISDKVCACCGSCDANITVDSVTRDGKDVVLSYTPNGTAYFVDFYLDGVFKGSAIVPALSVSPQFIFTNAADGVQHTYTILIKDISGAVCNTIEDTFIFLGCADVPIPITTVDEVTNAVCPYDLDSLAPSTPVGYSLEWHTANDTSIDTLVSDPLNVSSGIYYGFNKNSDGCYSQGVKVTIICNTEESCSAPQNLEVNYISGNYVITFQSAVYPPPANSYTVKRRLNSDPDVDGSYTTIGTPIWNASINKWQIFDNTASVNIHYVYKAQSNCGGSPATTPFDKVDFVNITCPTMNFTPGSTQIDYSFAPLGGDIDKYEVKIYDSTGTTLIHTDTHTPAFSNPITGTFEYLTDATDYKIAVTVYVGAYSKTCPSETVTTTAL